MLETKEWEKDVSVFSKFDYEHNQMAKIRIAAKLLHTHLFVLGSEGKVPSFTEYARRKRTGKGCVNRF